jgi:hypothetical protein
MESVASLCLHHPHPHPHPHLKQCPLSLKQSLQSLPISQLQRYPVNIYCLLHPDLLLKNWLGIIPTITFPSVQGLTDKVRSDTGDQSSTKLPVGLPEHVPRYCIATYVTIVRT